jgi:hypothetical protein
MDLTGNGPISSNQPKHSESAELVVKYVTIGLSRTLLT